MKLIYFFILVLLIYAPVVSSSSEKDKITEIQRKINILDERFKTLSSSFFKNTKNYSKLNNKSIDSIELLEESVLQLSTSEKQVDAIKLIFYNLSTVTSNLEHTSVFYFLALLLDNNEFSMANTLFTAIKQEGDNSLLATAQFLFAKYHALRHEWKQVNTLLNENISELSLENTGYAYLLKGAALQHLKQHRKALTYYSRISVSSEYYILSKLNTAIANIRQGWWSDAKGTIDNLLSKTSKDNSNEQINRLYLILGYSLLQKEYFREARNAFGHIGLKSIYTNRALLGIGLTATDQTDYTGSLNAISILMKQQLHDLSVDESYLLMPFIYEKLNHEALVVTSYSEAISYYDKRITILQDLSKKPQSFHSINFKRKTSEITISENNFNYGTNFPITLINNYYQLDKLIENTNIKSVKIKLQDLKNKHSRTLTLIIKFLIEQRIEYLQSYKNQCNYGLANFYDKNREQEK